MLHPRRLEGDSVEHLDAYIILGLIGALMLTLLLSGALLQVARPGTVAETRFTSRAIAAGVPGGGGEPPSKARLRGGIGPPRHVRSFRQYRAAAYQSPLSAGAVQ